MNLIYNHRLCKVEILPVLEFFRETMSVYKEIHCKVLAYTVVEPEKSYYLPLQSGDPAKLMV